MKELEKEKIRKVTIIKKVPEFNLGLRLILALVITIFDFIISYTLSLLFSGFNDNINVNNLTMIIFFLHSVLWIAFLLDRDNLKNKEETVWIKELESLKKEVLKNEK